MKYDHHPDPAIGFEIEVEEIESEAHNLKIGFGGVSRAALEERISKALEFRVGGDPGSVSAMSRLREINEAIKAVTP